MLRFLTFIISFIIISCSSTGDKHFVENTGYAQGTTYQIKYLSDQKTNYHQHIKHLFAEIDTSMSIYIPSSLISKVNEADTAVKVDSMFMKVMNRSIEIAAETNGDFDPTIGPLAQLWGFGFDEIRQDVTEKMIAEAKSKTGYSKINISGHKVSIPEGFKLDFNAIAQGFTVDVIAEFLESEGIDNYMVEVGGEIRAKGVNQNGNIWKIGVDKPQEEIDAEDRFQFIIELEDAALVTSGNYRKYWVDEKTGMRYSHTIDPETGRPAKNTLLSASILAPNAMDADAYATACMVMGLEECKEFIASKEKLEAYLVFTNSENEWDVFMSEGFKKFIVPDSL